MRNTDTPNRIPISRVVGALSAAVLIAGCATAKQEPFTAFQQSVAELNTGAATVLRKNEAMGTARYIAAATADPAKLAELLFRHEDGKPFAYSAKDAPFFVSERKFRQLVLATTDALERYAGALQSLADPGLIKATEFDQLAQELNANVFDAYSAIAGESPGSLAVAVISNATVLAVEAHIQNKRSGLLAEAIKENQATIDLLSKTLVTQITEAAEDSRIEYQALFTPARKKIKAAETAGNEAAVKALVTEMVSISMDHLDRVDKIEQLARAFAKIPDAHRQLAKAATGDQAPLDSIFALLTQAERLSAGVESSFNDNRYKAALADAKTADANAKAAEAQAGKVEAEVASLKKDLDKAKAASDADPTNGNKKEALEKIQERHERLTLLAESARERATDAREVADLAQAKADELKALAPSFKE